MVTNNVDQGLWFLFTRRLKRAIFLNTAKLSMKTSHDILPDLCPQEFSLETQQDSSLLKRMIYALKNSALKLSGTVHLFLNTSELDVVPTLSSMCFVAKYPILCRII